MERVIPELFEVISLLKIVLILVIMERVIPRLDQYRFQTDGVLILVIMERVIPMFYGAEFGQQCLNPGHNGKGDSTQVHQGEFGIKAS